MKFMKNQKNFLYHVTKNQRGFVEFLNKKTPKKHFNKTFNEYLVKFVNNVVINKRMNRIKE